MSRNDGKFRDHAGGEYEIVSIGGNEDGIRILIKYFGSVIIFFGASRHI